MRQQMKKKISDVKKEYFQTESKLNTAIKYLEQYQAREKEELSAGNTNKSDSASAKDDRRSSKTQSTLNTTHKRKKSDNLISIDSDLIKYSSGSKTD